LPDRRYEIIFRSELEDDLRPLGARLRKRVLNAIESRLAVDPELFGKALTHDLKGLRRIRVGDLRVAYQVTSGQVIVWAILNRKTVYAELARRILRLRR
jgi:mRNA interferase RelE/StbE